MAVDYHLKLDGIPGEDQTDGFVGQVQILSFSWGASNISSVAGTGGSGAGKVSVSELSIMTFFDKATPAAFKAICLGTHIKTGTLSAVKSGAGGKPYITVDFQELFVSSLQISGANENPSVSMGFTYDQMTLKYYAQNEQGTLTLASQTTYNTKQNKTT